MDSMKPDMGDKKDPHGELLRRREEIWAELQVLDLEDRDPQRRAELREELNGIAKMLSDEQVKDERLTPAQQKNTRIALIVGAAALLIGAVGPWATLLGALSVSPLSQPDEWTAVIGVAFSSSSWPLSRRKSGAGCRSWRVSPPSARASIRWSRSCRRSRTAIGARWWLLVGVCT
jgi:hypothetical protein